MKSPLLTSTLFSLLIASGCAGPSIDDLDSVDSAGEGQDDQSTTEPGTATETGFDCLDCFGICAGDTAAGVYRGVVVATGDMSSVKIEAFEGGTASAEYGVGDTYSHWWALPVGTPVAFRLATNSADQTVPVGILYSLSEGGSVLCRNNGAPLHLDTSDLKLTVELSMVKFVELSAAPDCESRLTQAGLADVCQLP